MLTVAVPAGAAGLARSPIDRDAAPAGTPPQRLAVAEFEERGVMAGFGAAVGELLVAAIDREDLLVVERGQLRRVVDERRLAESDLVARAVALGEVQEAQLVLVGSVYRLEGRILVSARVVDLQGRLHERRSGTVIVRTIEELEGAVEILAHRLGLRGAAPQRGGERLLNPAPVSDAVGARAAAIAGALPRGNPFGLELRLVPQRDVVVFGDPIEVEVTTTRPGFLTLVVTDSAGHSRVLLPNEARARLLVEAGRALRVPERLGFRMVATAPVGLTRIKAIVTQRPVDHALFAADGAMPAPLREQLAAGDFSAAEVEFAVAEDAPRAWAWPSAPDAPRAPAEIAPIAVPQPTDAAAVAPPAAPGVWHLDGDSPAAIGWAQRHAALVPPLIAVIDAGFELRDERLAHAWLRDASGEIVLIDLRPSGGAHGDPIAAAIPATAGHGHAVASLIAARPQGRSEGVQGVLPQATLLPIVVASAEQGPAWRTPRGDAALLLEALGIAADLGARVVNVSLGVPVGEAELRRLSADPVWDRLEALGVVVVCAAGNDGRDLDAAPIFPAAVDRPGVIAVMALDRSGAPLGAGETPSPAGLRTAVGARRVALAAPGIDLIAAGARTQLVQVEGTSFAAPLVAAAAAALLAQEPQRTPAEVAQRLIELSEPLPALHGLARGGALRLP